MTLGDAPPNSLVAFPVVWCLSEKLGALLVRDGNGAGSGRVEHTHARPDMGSG
jgi:hypothetical protein